MKSVQVTYADSSVFHIFGQTSGATASIVFAPRERIRAMAVEVVLAAFEPPPVRGRYSTLAKTPLDRPHTMRPSALVFLWAWWDALAI